MNLTHVTAWSARHKNISQSLPTVIHALVQELLAAMGIGPAFVQSNIQTNPNQLSQWNSFCCHVYIRIPQTKYLVIYHL